mmetsp:Transcript_13929/g.32459  ORF Transcript_13929/g.32459 Transcript_13929/m.32459 type:complete len:287 (-) Transcript_13929:298-1158(-)
MSVMYTELGADVLAAAAAASIVAPTVAAIDKAVAESSADPKKLWPSFFATGRQICTKPHVFVRSPAFLWITGLYTGTYAAVNIMSSYEERCGERCPTTKSTVVVGVNGTLAMMKDRALAVLASGRSPAPLPSLAVGAWLGRDAIGMTACFVLPEYVGELLAKWPGLTLSQQATNVAQMTVPLMAQPAVSPFHLLGYLAYNQPHASYATYWESLKGQVGGVAALRVLRGFPPYCVGAVANKSLRERLHGAAESVEDAFGNVVQGLVPAAVVMGVQAREAHLRRHITE